MQLEIFSVKIVNVRRVLAQGVDMVLAFVRNFANNTNTNANANTNVPVKISTFEIHMKFQNMSAALSVLPVV